MFNLKEFMNKEFLRPRENSCKWFNDFGVTRKWVYIESDGKCKFSHKNNWMNQFTKYVSQFKPLNDKTGKKKNTMKIDTYQERFESIQNPQDVDWYGSDKKWIDSNQFREYSWYVSILNDTQNRFIVYLSRFTQVREFMWYDSINDESIY